MDMSTQRKHLLASIDKAPPAVNSIRPGRGAANGCSAIVLSATPIAPGPNVYSKGTVVCLIQTDKPMLAPVKPPKFKHLDDKAKKAEMLAKEEEIKADVKKEFTIYSGTKLRFTYKSGPDANQLSFGDHITIQGMDVAPSYTETKDDPGNFHGSTFYNVNMIVKLKSMIPSEIDEVMEKLAKEQSIPIVFTQAITDRDLLEEVRAQADRITTITRIGGPDSTLEDRGGYWIIPVNVPADKLNSASKYGKEDGKVPSMMSSLAGYISNGEDILTFGYSTAWYESSIAAAWDITSAELWVNMFKTLVSKYTRVYVIGTFDTRGTSNSHLMCRPPKVFASTVNVDKEIDEAMGEETEVVKYDRSDAAFGFVVDTSVVIPEFLSLVRIGYPMLSAKTVKTLLPTKNTAITGQASRPSATQSRGFVCANSASAELVDDLLRAGWIGVYITNHAFIINKDGETIQPYQIPADILWTPDYPKEEKLRNDRIAKALAVQKKDAKPNNPFILGLEQLSKRSGPPDINKADAIIYLMDPVHYRAAVEKLMNPQTEDDVADTGALGLLVKQSEMSREAAVKVITDHAKFKAALGDVPDDAFLDDGEVQNGETKIIATSTPPAPVEEEVPAHQPEDTGMEDAMDDGNDKKRARSSEEEEEEEKEVKAPPAKRSKVAEHIAKTAAAKKKVVPK